MLYSELYYSVRKGSVAQRLEQGIHKPKVVGSNPTRATHLQYCLKLKLKLKFQVLNF